MLGLALVRPLEEDWREVLDAVARRRKWPTSHDVADLADRVSALSAAYNDASIAHAAMREAGAARLLFAFARDVPKGAAAVRELVATGALRCQSAPLRVLDVGAGLGAMTRGLVRALAMAGRRHDSATIPRVVEATWLDPDAQALALGLEVAREREAIRAAQTPISLRVTIAARSVEATSLPDDRAQFDVVLVGNVLSELHVGASDDQRVALHAALLADLLERRVDEHGSLVVVEPALRDRTRHLHRVRDALASGGATVFAPCLHSAPCPALDRESDWCHEDIPVDLPRWLQPVARKAGLRWQGLTFSYLVLRKDGLRLADALGLRSGAARLRIVSEPMRTKGKRDAFVCGELPAQAPGAVRVRATRLDRHATELNAPWGEIKRGDVIVVDPAPTAERPRIGDGVRVRRLGDTE